MKGDEDDRQSKKHEKGRKTNIDHLSTMDVYMCVIVPQLRS